MDSLKGKGASVLAMENRHMVNLHSAHALCHIGDVVALHLGAEQQVALAQAAHTNAFQALGGDANG